MMGMAASTTGNQKASDPAVSCCEAPARATAREMGENARRRAIDHFISTRHLTQYVQLFTELVNGGLA